MKANGLIKSAVWISVVTFVVSTPSPVWAQRGARGRGRPQAPQGAGKQLTALVGADIYTVSREVIRRGTVLIQGDKILDVGQDLEVPPAARVIDCKGKYITPGFIAISMSRVGLAPSGATSNPADGLDPFDRNIKLALGVGITSGCLEVSRFSGGFRRRLPNERFLGLEPEGGEATEENEDDVQHNPDFGLTETSVCACCGLPILPIEPITPSRPSQSTPVKQLVIKMSFGELASMLVSDSPVYALSSRALGSPLNRHEWRETVKKARKYLEEQARHEQAVKSGAKQNPPRKTVSDEVIKVVKKDIPLRVRADSIDDIRDMVALAGELDHRLVLDGVVEGWLTAEELGKARVPVVLTPRMRRSAERGKEDSSGSSIESSGIFERTGVPFALSTLSSSISLNGLAGRDLTSLPLEAAFAVRGGCSEATALAALTLVPAQILGLQHRLGSVDPGKDADLLVLDGPPLDYRTYVELAMVNGKIRYDRQQDRVYPVFER